MTQHSVVRLLTHNVYKVSSASQVTFTSPLSSSSEKFMMRFCVLDTKWKKEIIFAGWHSARDLVPEKKNSNITSVIVSPSFTFLPGSCQHFHFSFDLKSDSFIKSFVLTQTNSTQRLILTSKMCQTYMVKSGGPKRPPATLRLVIASDSKIWTERAAVSVTSQRSCPSFGNFSSLSSSTRAPHFHTVKRGETNLCSLEIHGRKMVKCDWLNVRDVDNADYDRVSSHSCIPIGVKHDRGQTWFLALKAKDQRSRALLISPVVEGGSSYVLFSFWFMIKCKEPRLRVYLVPYSHSSATAWTSQHLVAEVKQLVKRSNWQFKSLRIPVPSNYSKFQVSTVR